MYICTSIQLCIVKFTIFFVSIIDLFYFVFICLFFFNQNKSAVYLLIIFAGMSGFLKLKFSPCHCELCGNVIKFWMNCNSNNNGGGSRLSKIHGNCVLLLVIFILNTYFSKYTIAYE